MVPLKATNSQLVPLVGTRRFDAVRGLARASVGRRLHGEDQGVRLTTGHSPHPVVPNRHQAEDLFTFPDAQLPLSAVPAHEEDLLLAKEGAVAPSC